MDLKRGDDTPKGFAFAAKNPGNEDATFRYNVSAQSVYNCGTSFSIEEANSYIVNPSGTLTATRGSNSDTQIVRFLAPKTAPACTVTYNLVVTGTGSTSFNANKQVLVNYK